MAASKMITTQDIVNIIRTTNLPGAATQAIDPEATFYEQGIDSLDALTIMLRVEEAFAIPVPDDAVGRLDSVQSLANYINEYRSAQASGHV